MPDYFEIDRLIEDLAKVYSTACATTWFKVSMNKKPTVEEFRTKVVDFMKNFETQKFLLEATKKLCEEKGIELIIFQQDSSSVQDTALKLKGLLEDKLAQKVKN